MTLSRGEKLSQEFSLHGFVDWTWTANAYTHTHCSHPNNAYKLPKHNTRQKLKIGTSATRLFLFVSKKMVVTGFDGALYTRMLCPEQSRGSQCKCMNLMLNLQHLTLTSSPSLMVLLAGDAQAVDDKAESKHMMLSP